MTKRVELKLLQKKTIFFLYILLVNSSSLLLGNHTIGVYINLLPTIIPKSINLINRSNTPVYLGLQYYSH